MEAIQREEPAAPRQRPDAEALCLPPKQLARPGSAFLAGSPEGGGAAGATRVTRSASDQSLVCRITCPADGDDPTEPLSLAGPRGEAAELRPTVPADTAKVAKQNLMIQLQVTVVRTTNFHKT